MFEIVLLLLIGAAIGFGGLWLILMFLFDSQNDRKD
jgi:hypothetical protein